MVQVGRVNAPGSRRPPYRTVASSRAAAMRSPDQHARVLIVDDDPRVALDLCTRLPRLGYEVVGHASSASEALSIAARSPPELVLMDLGFAAQTDATWQLYKQFDVSIVYLVESGDLAAPHSSGAQASWTFLQKPMDDDTLRSVLKATLRNRRLSHRDDNLAARALELQHALHAKDSFVAGMSHELRTPLASILGYADVLLMGLPGRLNGRQKKYVTTIQRNGEHLLSLINDLLDLEKLNAGPVDLCRETVSCRQVLDETRAAFEPLAVAKHLRLEMHASEPRLTALADRRALQQVLFNLVGNAIKFTEQGEVRVTCRRVIEGERETVSWEVRDTGVGLSEDEQQKLFRPFARMASGRNSTQRGSGLGLHLSRRLAELMSGSIRVESVLNVGSLFTLVLPASVADDAVT
jgi:signal transduction histidine kinase